MMTEPHFQKYPDTWIKVWVGIGLFAFAGMISMMVLLQTAYGDEIQRYSECVDGVRRDCDPSFYWLLQGWDTSVIDGSPSGMSTSTVDTTEIALPGTPEPRSIRSSDTAPLINSVEPQGMTLNNGTYSAASGTTVKVKAEVDGAKTVELYLIPKTNGTAGAPKKVATMAKQADGSYAGSFKVTNNLSADLEVRAINAKKETASLFLNVAAE